MLPAQTILNWQPGGSGTGFSGTGTWDTTTSNWTSDNTGVAAPGLWTNGNVAHFGANGTAYTVTVGSGISVTGIVLDGAYNTTDFVGSNLTLNGSYGTPTITLGTSGPTPVFEVGFTGSAGLNIVANDNSSLELHGSSTYTGVTTIGGPYQTTVFVGDPAALGATGPGNGTVVNDSASLWLGNAAASSSISVAEDFTFNTTGVLHAAVSNATVTGNIILGSDLRLDAGGNTLELDGIISESVAGRGLTVENSGTTVLTGANTFTGNISIPGGTLWISTLANSGASSAAGKGSGFTLGDYNGEGYDNGTLVYTGVSTSSDRSIVLAGNTGTITVLNPATTLTLTGLISHQALNSGSGDFEKAGPGTLELTGNNTYTGDTLLTTGTLLVGHSNALGTTGEVVVGTGNTATNDNLSLLLENGVTLGLDVDVANTNSGSGTTTLGMTGTGSSTFSDAVYISRNINLTADAGGTVNFAAYFTDGGGAATHNITKIGAGQAVFANGIDLRAGGLTINGGEVQLRSSTNLNFFSGGIIVHTGGILSGDATVTGGNVLVGSGGVVKPGVNGLGNLAVNNLYLGSSSTLHWQLSSLTTTGTPEIVVTVSDSNTEVYTTATFNIDLTLLGISQRPDYGTPDPFWQAGHTWLAVDFNGIVAGQPNLQPGYLNPLTVTNGNFATGTFSTFIDTNGDLNLQFTPVPEPSTYALLGLGGLLLFRPRRRRA